MRGTPKVSEHLPPQSLQPGPEDQSQGYTCKPTAHSHDTVRRAISSVCNTPARITSQQACEVGWVLPSFRHVETGSEDSVTNWRSPQRGARLVLLPRGLTGLRPSLH